MISGWGRLPADDCTTEAEAHGWPARALWSVAESDDTWPGPLTWRRDGALGVSADLSLPTFIVWRGFVFDTLFYAVPWWIVLITPGAVVRWRRKRRGACVACGYDLRGLVDAEKGKTVCPECGT